jgi:hypothetical protein
MDTVPSDSDISLGADESLFSHIAADLRKVGIVSGEIFGSVARADAACIGDPKHSRDASVRRIHAAHLATIECHRIQLIDIYNFITIYHVIAQHKCQCYSHCEPQGL